MNWVALLNVLLPAVTNVIVTIRHSDGTQTAVVFLDQADANIAETEKAIAEWRASKNKPTPP